MTVSRPCGPAPARSGRLVALLVALAGACALAGAASPALAATAPRSQLTATSAAALGPRIPPVHGYDAHWLFNANDGTPIVHVSVARNGTFAFAYRPSYCGAGGFRLTGAFSHTRASYLGTPGYAVVLKVSGSCAGHGQSAGNTFTWSKPTAVSVLSAWPDSRSVQGQLIQTAVAGTARGDLAIDLSMSAA